MSIFMRGVIGDIEDERRKQNAKWGDVDEEDRHMPFGTTPTAGMIEARDFVISETNRHAREGTLTWWHILREEYVEAMAEDEAPANWLNLRKELVQIAAVATAMVEAGDLRASDEKAKNKG